MIIIFPETWNAMEQTCPSCFKGTLGRGSAGLELKAGFVPRQPLRCARAAQVCPSHHSGVPQQLRCAQATLPQSCSSSPGWAEPSARAVTSSGARTWGEGLAAAPPVCTWSLAGHGLRRYRRDLPQGLSTRERSSSRLLYHLPLVLHHWT